MSEPGSPHDIAPLEPEAAAVQEETAHSRWAALRALPWKQIGAVALVLALVLAMGLVCTPAYWR